MTKTKCFVIYGPAGTGKTTIAASFPTPIALGDCRDEGTDSVSDIDPKKLQVFPIENWDDIETFYHQIKGKMLEDENGKSFIPKTVVLDTITNVQQMAIEEALRRKKKSTKKAAGDWGSMTKQDWGDVASLMKQWIALYKDLGINVVFLAQMRVFNTDDDGAGSGDELLPEVGARLSPSVKDALNAAADVIGSTFIKRKIKVKEIKGKKVKSERHVYCLRVGPNPIYITKIRKPKKIEAPEIIEDATYEDIMSVVKGEA